MTTARRPTPDVLGEIMTGRGQSPEKLNPDDIATTGGTQMRIGITRHVVLEYADNMRNGDKFPPIEVYHDGETYWLSDGFHRLAAWKEVHRSEKIPAIIKPGTRRDAILAAAKANARHGLRRTSQDKRRTVLTLLEDDEWSQWSDNEIARRCGVSQPFVSKLRKTLTYNVISEEPREPLTGNVASEKPAERTYITKHGTQATMNTANIGRNNGPIPAPQPAPAEDDPKEETPLITVEAVRARARELAKGPRRHFPTMAELFPEKAPAPQPAPAEVNHSDQIVRINDFMAENLPDFYMSDGDTATCAIAAMTWLLNEIDRLKGKEPTVTVAPTAPAPPADLPDWRDGWTDGDEGEYNAMGEYWTVEQITRPRVAVRLYEEQGAEFKPALLRRYQELS